MLGPKGKTVKLILASSSPRRAEILRNAGFAFDVLAEAVDETPQAHEAPAALVERLAAEKARAAAEHAGPAVVIAADTVVVREGRIFGKPDSPADAAAMLRHLSGKTHEVLTGLALLMTSTGRLRVEHEVTRVTLASLSEAEIADYVVCGQPMGKAGAYAIQGRGGVFVTRVEGCYFNVVGLPLARLYRMLRELEGG
jgi:septum formation protein